MLSVCSVRYGDSGLASAHERTWHGPSPWVGASRVRDRASCIVHHARESRDEALELTGKRKAAGTEPRRTRQEARIRPREQGIRESAGRRGQVIVRAGSRTSKSVNANLGSLSLCADACALGTGDAQRLGRGCTALGTGDAHAHAHAEKEGGGHNGAPSLEISRTDVHWMLDAG